MKIEKLFTSPILPVVREKIKFRTTIFNEGDKPVERANLTLYLGKDKKKRFKQITIGPIGGGERQKIEIGEWRAEENGVYEVELYLDTEKEKKATKFSFPVVERKVEFAWYGTPKDLRWATLSTTIEEDYIGEWLWEGRTALAFKPGVCFWDTHKDASVEEQVFCWSKIPGGAEGIGIDEYYGGGEAGEKVIEAIKKFKERHPNLKVALWCVGAIPEDIVPYVDYFLPECYLNYHNMHLGILRKYLEEIRDKKLERKTLLGLGINYQPNQGVLLTTSKELEAQFRIIKSLCPNILGIAIFYYGSVPQLDKLSDELFYRYFVLPVITYEWQIKEYQGKPVVVGKVKNIGNMDGGPVEVFLWVDGKETKKSTIKRLKVEETKDFTFVLDNMRSGFHTIKVKIKTGSNITILDSEEEEAIGIDVPALKSEENLAVWLPSSPYPRRQQPLRFSLPNRWASARVFLSNYQGEATEEISAQSSEKGELIWVEKDIPPGKNRFYIIYPEEKANSSFSPQENIDFVNEFYQVSLDITKDEIRSLKVNGENLFSSPWRIELHPSFNLTPLRAEVLLRKGKVFQEVIVPLKGNGLKGRSHYIFYFHSPLIEIRREIIPEIALELDLAREGAGFEQREGFFQAFPGEEAMRINKGRLENSEQYRDIYFGYLGSSPAPDNSRKVGWLDFCWDKPPLGLGIGVVKRWIDSRSRTYDVTRFYDGGDWVDIFYVFQTSTQINRPQESFILLLPHKSCDLEKGIAPILPFYLTERKGPKMVAIFNSSKSQRKF